MNNNSTDFTKKGISTRRDMIESSKTISEYRYDRERDIEELGSKFDDVNKDLKKRLDYLEKIEQKGKREIDLIRELNTYQKELNELQISNNIEYSTTLETLNETVKALDKANKITTSIQYNLAKTSEGRERVLQQSRFDQEQLNYLSQEISRMIETHKKANQSKLDEFSKNLNDFRGQVRDLALVTGMSSIGSRIQASNSISSMYGYGSFGGMQSSAFSNLVNNYGLMDTVSKFNYKDMLEYMGRLEQLGITSLDIAKQQADDIMFSTKYLGMSVDTQNKILKQARDTGNMDLLTEANQTMVQIMDAQLGISKTQLEKTVNQAASLSDLVNFYSKDSNAMAQFTKGLSALEKMYGKDSSTSVSNIASRILSNDTSLLQYMPGYYNIQSKLARGDASALYDIVQSIQGSGMVNAMSNSNGVLGLPDQDIRNIFTARNSTNGSYGGWLEQISNGNKDTNKYLEGMKESVMTVVENVGSWLNKWLSIEFLQSMYYPLAITSMLADNGGKILSFVKRGFGKLDILSKATEKIGLSFGTTSGGLSGTGTGLLGSIGNIASVLSLIAGIVMAIGDGVDGLSKKDEWGTSSGASFFGGVLGGTDSNEATRMLKNGGKGMLIGAGIGGILGATLFGIGAIPGAIIGGLLGLAIGSGLGAVGGENIAKGIDGFLGRSESGASGGVSTAPITNLSNSPRNSSFTGRGGSANGSYPWTLTSPFGYRGSFYTSAGYTNPYHNGIDLASSSGTPIGANNSGTVSAVGTDGSRGNYAIINSGDGYEQVYYHMLQPSNLVKGQGINAGQLVGLMGSTGMSTGTHLHFGLRHAGTNNYIDPQPYVNNELFNVDSRGTTGLGIMGLGLYGDEEKDELRSSTLIARTVDANTLSTEVASGLGGEGIIQSVDSGFANLINKLDELSQRQDAQEEMLSILAGSGSTQLLKY